MSSAQYSDESGSDNDGRFQVFMYVLRLALSSDILLY